MTKAFGKGEKRHTRVTITPRETTETRISPLLCGNFIELGYGLQVDGMRSEMLSNRIEHSPVLNVTRKPVKEDVS